MRREDSRRKFVRIDRELPAARLLQAGADHHARGPLAKPALTSNVRTGLSVSLDAFFSGPNDGAEVPIGFGGDTLLAGYSAGDPEYTLPGTDVVFMISAQTAEHLPRRAERHGRWCLVEGRSTSRMGGWPTPLGRTGPCCYQLGPTRVGLRGIPVYLGDGRTRKRPSARKAVAGDEDARVAVASIVQQCIKAGLFDEYT
jgi:hypothetical protein